MNALPTVVTLSNFLILLASIKVSIFLLIAAKKRSAQTAPIYIALAAFVLIGTISHTQERNPFWVCASAVFLMGISFYLIWNAQDFFMAETKERDEFLSVLSHELKSSITALSLRIQILNKRNPELSMLQRCNQDCRELNELIDKIFASSLLCSGKLELARERVELIHLLKEVVETLQSEAEVNRSTIRIYESRPTFGNWDRTRIKQVLNNLVSNAIKYGRGQVIEILTQPDDLNHRVSVSIRDHGMGISPAMHKKIFDRYVRAVPPGQGAAGLGLGLFLVRQIIEVHGGKVKVESTPQQGSTFTIELPTCDQDARTTGAMQFPPSVYLN